MEVRAPGGDSCCVGEQYVSESRGVDIDILQLVWVRVMLGSLGAGIALGRG